MKNLILLLVIQVYCLTGNTQDTIIIFLDDNYFKTDKVNAKFIREAIISENHYQITDKNIDGALVNYCEYKSLIPRIEEGLAKHYCGPDTLYSSGYYINGKMLGQWIYYNNDNTIDTVYYLPLEDYYGKSKCPKSKHYIKSPGLKNLGDIVIDSLKSFIVDNFHIPGRLIGEDDYYFFNINCTYDTDGRVKCPEIAYRLNEDIIIEIFRILHEFEYKTELEKPIRFNVAVPYTESRDSTDDIFIIVEDMPTFMGGDQNKFREYIEQNLSYPTSAAERGISGKVFVQFVVNTQGKVVDAKVVHSADPDLDAEALRVVQSSPRWKPGMHNGEPVNVQFTFPIIFILGN
jgi:TonB family protein